MVRERHDGALIEYLTGGISMGKQVVVVFIVVSTTFIRKFNYYLFTFVY